MSKLSLVGVIYGIFLLAGGFFGLKAGSKVSLIMGIVSGLAALTGAHFVGINFALGARILLGVSGVLSIVFLKRLLETHKMMPSGMLLIVSVGVLLFVASQLFKK